ncbi:MAG: 2Fe-2S iron-sulfur cluster binding domain-containing protein [Cyanobacteria bacterium]|nr:2Fe-2S iron-sulfur cluster binding domain-containing protein [Cyanobacteriota bacterium]
MHTTIDDPHRHRYACSVSSCFLTMIVTLLLLSVSGRPAGAQTTADEHAQHHPAANATPATPGSGPVPSPGMVGMPGAPPGGAMAAEMGEMMKQMGAPPPKELYPSLMALPDEITPEQRAAIEQLARERMKTGAASMSAGLEKLAASTADEDFAAMQQAAAQMRQGLAEFEAGLAARQVLSEGKAARNLALDWFKREMNLASPIPPETRRTLLGVTPLHLFTMGLLIVFALAMVTMYFFKMRRAAVLFGRLAPDTNPTPGGAPPPGGGSGPSSPPAGPTTVVTPPPSGAGAPPASATPPSASTIVKSTSVSPVTTNWRGHLRVASIVAETPTVKTFRLVPSSGNELPFTFVPGQFLNVTFSIGGARMNRSYSISSSPAQQEYVELTVKREPRGAVSRHINDLLKVGDQIEAGGPVGRFTFTGTEADSVVLIAGGVGVTPLMSIARYLTDRAWEGDIFLVYGCSNPTEFIFRNDIAALQRTNPKLHAVVTMERPDGAAWEGPTGRITKDLLIRAVPDLPTRRIHLCGPIPMMNAVKAILRDSGVAPEQVKTESFGTLMPAPPAPGTFPPPTVAATGPLVTFSRNRRSARIHVDQTVLEFSEELAIGIEYSCRVGTCGVCKVRMTSGEVEMAVEDALDPDDKVNGIILACQAKPTSDIVVEA